MGVTKWDLFWYAGFSKRNSKWRYEIKLVKIAGKIRFC